MANFDHFRSFHGSKWAGERNLQKRASEMVSVCLKAFIIMENGVWRTPNNVFKDRDKLLCISNGYKFEKTMGFMVTVLLKFSNLWCTLEIVQIVVLIRSSQSSTVCEVGAISLAVAISNFVCKHIPINRYIQYIICNLL